MAKEDNPRHEIPRRQFLRWLGVGAGGAAMLPSFRLLAAVPGENPLAGSVNRDWERIYRDQFRYDRQFDWVCSPNDTHACRVRAYVRNGIVVRLGATYDYQDYADLYGNKATVNWNPRQCAKGYTFHRVLYGPYRLRHPIVRKGWKAWADDGFPFLTPELRSKYLFDRRGEDEFVQISWDDVFHDIAGPQVHRSQLQRRAGAAAPALPGLPARDGQGHPGGRHPHRQDARGHGPFGGDGQVRHVPPQQLPGPARRQGARGNRKSTRLNSSHT